MRGCVGVCVCVCAPFRGSSSYSAEAERYATWIYVEMAWGLHGLGKIRVEYQCLINVYGFLNVVFCMFNRMFFLSSLEGQRLIAESATTRGGSPRRRVAAAEVEILQNVGIRPASLSPASEKRFEDIQKLGEALSHWTF